MSQRIEGDKNTCSQAKLTSRLTLNVAGIIWSQRFPATQVNHLFVVCRGYATKGWLSSTILLLTADTSRMALKTSPATTFVAYRL